MESKSNIAAGIPLWCIVLSCFVFITFLSFSSFLAVIPCVLMCPRKWPPPRPIVISTSQQGYVVRSYVKEGQKIRKGDRLYELDTSKTTRSGVVSDNEFNEITSQLHGIDEIIRNPKRGETKHCSQLKIREINIRKHTISRLRLYELQSRDYKNGKQHEKLWTVPEKWIN